MWETIKDYYHKYWFFVSSLIIAILYGLFVHRGRKIGELTDQIKVNKIKKELDTLTSEASKSEEKSKEAGRKYEDLKRRHPGIVNKLGLH